MSHIVRIIIIWYTSIFLTVEILSFFNLISRPFFLIFQLTILLALFKFLNFNPFKLKSEINFRSKTAVIILILSGLTFIQGFFSAPSTTDSMVYHLPRVMYWIQEKTVYQEIIRNEHDFMAPFGEYILLDLYLILNNDHLVFFSQWISFLTIIYLSGVIASQLGADQKQKNIIRILTATLPIALMQSVSTQIDLVVTALLAVVIHIALLILKRFSYKYIFVLGWVVGLGVLTKATFFIYAVLPLGLVIYALRASPRKLFISGTIILSLILLVTVRFFVQNYSLYGNFLGKHILPGGEEITYTNEIITPLGLLSNILRNILAQVPIPVFNILIEEKIRQVYFYFNMNINDPLITCCGEFRILPVIYPQEDIVSNPLQIFLILIGIVYLFRSKYKHNVKIFFFLVLVSFVLFSLVIKWQPYHSRLEMPVFVFGTISAVLLLGKSENMLKLVVGLSIFLSFIIIALNVSRPYISYGFFYNFISQFSKPKMIVPEAFYIKPRDYQYFNARFYWHEPYNQVVRLLKTEPNVKVTFDLFDNYEYPLWVMLKDQDADFKVVPPKEKDKANFLIKTTGLEGEEQGFEKVSCYKTRIDYGYACIYKRGLFF